MDIIHVTNPNAPGDTADETDIEICKQKVGAYVKYKKLP